MHRLQAVTLLVLCFIPSDLLFAPWRAAFSGEAEERPVERGVERPAKKARPPVKASARPVSPEGGPAVRLSDPTAALRPSSTPVRSTAVCS